MNEPIPATGYKMHCHDQKQEAVTAPFCPGHIEPLTAQNQIP